MQAREKGKRFEVAIVQDQYRSRGVKRREKTEEGRCVFGAKRYREKKDSKNGGLTNLTHRREPETRLNKEKKCMRQEECRDRSKKKRPRTLSTKMPRKTTKA